MFSHLKNKAHSATICYLSSKMKAVKNRMVEYLDQMTKERREVILKKAIGFVQKKRRKKTRDILEEILNRMAEKTQPNDDAARRKFEKKLKEIKPLMRILSWKEFRTRVQGTNIFLTYWPLDQTTDDATNRSGG